MTCERLIRQYVGLCCCVFLINVPELLVLTFGGVFFLFFLVDRSGQFLRRHWGHDWLQTKPMDEMELDHNHSCPLHGERRYAVCFLALPRFIANGHGHRRIDTAKVWSLQPALKVACFFVFFQGCFVFSLVKYKPLTYNKVYEYPDWAIGLGWCLALSSMICIPMVMVIKILQSEGPLIEVRDVLRSCFTSVAQKGH